MLEHEPMGTRARKLEGEPPIVGPTTISSSLLVISVAQLLDANSQVDLEVRCIHSFVDGTF